MKKFIPLLLLFFAPYISYSQILTVKDAETSEPIPVVTIYSESLDIYAVTNQQGKAKIDDLENADDIEIRILGYQTIVRTYSELRASEFEVFLKPKELTMSEFVVSATRWRQSSENIPSKISSITPEIVQLQNPQTAADLLSLSGEVFIQKSQQGGGSPMIRGFATNRLLYTIDGVRMNTAIFRGGNIQNVISLDPYAIESTEVLFGPGSVIYGSDAIGGVMSFRTLSPELSPDGGTSVNGKTSFRYSSANSENTGHFHLNVGLKKWAFISSISANDYDHLRQGSNGPEDYIKRYHVESQLNNDEIALQNDPQLQIPTAYSQINAMQKILYRPNASWEFNYGMHYSETTPYGRYDRHNRTRNGLPRYAEWNYGPQKWMMNHLNTAYTGNNSLFDNLSLSLAQQYFEESRISRDLNASDREIRTEEVDAYSVNLDFLKMTGEKNTLYYGFEYVRNIVNSEGVKENIETDISQAGPARYPDATWQSIAVYISDEYDLSEDITVHSGLRYNRVLIDADFETRFYPLPFKEASVNNGSLTGSLGAVFKPAEDWIISTNLSTAFRAPNVDDIGKIFDSEPGSVVVPNPDLDPEYAYNFDLGVAHSINDAFQIDLTGYYTLLDNAIVRRDYTLNGADSLIYDGVNSKIQALQNAATANVYGIQAGVNVDINNAVTFSSDFNYQKGEEELDDGSTSPSRHAAPWFGVTRLIYDQEDLNFQLNAQYQGERKHENLSVSERGKTEIYALDENGNTYSPAWYTLNFKALYTLNETYTVSAGLENITDQRYRPYSSGVSGPGRNFILALSIQI